MRNLITLVEDTVFFFAELTDEYDQVQALSHALTELPHAHYETLKYLMGHLYRYIRDRFCAALTSEHANMKCWTAYSTLVLNIHYLNGLPIFFNFSFLSWWCNQLHNIIFFASSFQQCSANLNIGSLVFVLWSGVLFFVSMSIFVQTGWVVKTNLLLLLFLLQGCSEKRQEHDDWRKFVHCFWTNSYAFTRSGKSGFSGRLEVPADCGRAAYLSAGCFVW